MGRLAKVLEFRRVDDEEGKAVEVKCDLGGGNIVTAEYFSEAGDDAQPFPGEVVALVEGPGSGAWFAIGYQDPSLVGIAEAGERVIFSRSALGQVVAKAHFKKTGEVAVSNAAGGFTLKPDGSVDANGATITTDGDVVSATGVSLANHVHPTPMGPTGAPTPTLGP